MTILNYNTNKFSRGFSLIETFVAITILTIAVIGPLSLLAKAIADGAYAKNQITSYYLAQEGIELVINAKEKNSANGQDWLSGLSPECTNNSCAIDIAGNVNVCDHSNTACATLSLNNNGLYIHQGISPTLFKRTVKIDLVDSNEGAVINSTVSWIYNGEYTDGFTISSFITNPN